VKQDFFRYYKVNFLVLFMVAYFLQSLQVNNITD